MKYTRKITNVQKYIVQNNPTKVGIFTLSDRFFYIQRKLISDIYPAFPNNYYFKVYLYLCMRCDGKSGDVWISKQQISNKLKITIRPQVDRALDWLEQNHFIVCTNTKSGQRYQAKILAVPDYLPETRMFYKYANIRRDTYELKINNCGFILVPRSAITNSMLDESLTRGYWDERKLKTFLLMYQYNWLNYYGGIDPNIMHITQNDELNLDLGYCFDLQSDPYKTSRTIQSLIREGLFKPVRCIFRRRDGKQVFIGDVGRVPPQKNDQEIIILRPQVLFRNQELLDRLGKGEIII